jgi:hypothetical protein
MFLFYIVWGKRKVKDNKRKNMLIDQRNHLIEIIDKFINVKNVNNLIKI